MGAFDAPLKKADDVEDRRIVGIFLHGRVRELPVAQVACALAGPDRYALSVILVRPYSCSYAALYAPVDPEVLAREAQLQARGYVRELLEAAGLETRYTVSIVGRPATASAIRRAAEEGCGKLVLPHPRSRTVDLASCRLALRLGVELVKVGPGPDVAGAHSVPPAVSVVK